MDDPEKNQDFYYSLNQKGNISNEVLIFFNFFLGADFKSHWQKVRKKIFTLLSGVF